MTQRLAFFALLAVQGLPACVASNDDHGATGTDRTLTIVDTDPLLPDTDDTDDTGTPGDTDLPVPLLGAPDLGVGVHHDPSWVTQFGDNGFEEAFSVATSSTGAVYVGGITHSSWYAPFLDPCLDTENAVPRDCGDAVVFDADTLVGVQVGDTRSDETREIVVDSGGVSFGGRLRDPLSEEQGGFVMQYSLDLTTELWDERMLRSEFLGLGRFEDKIYAVGGTLFNWEPGELNWGKEDALTLKLQSDNGDIRAIQQVGSPLFDELHDVTADEDGVYITGASKGYLGSDVGGVNPEEEDDVVLFIWSPTLLEADEICRVQFGTIGRELGEGVAVNGDFVYVAGNVDGVLNEGLPNGGTCFHENDDKLADAFVAKYDKQCQHIWTRQWGSTMGDVAEGLAVDDDHVYVVGYAFSQLDHVDEPRAQTTDGYLRVYDHDGGLEGEILFDSSTSKTDLHVDYARAVAVDATTVYVAGSTEGDLGNTVNAGAGDIWLARIPIADTIDNVAYDGFDCTQAE